MKQRMSTPVKEKKYSLMELKKLFSSAKIDKPIDMKKYVWVDHPMIMQPLSLDSFLRKGDIDHSAERNYEANKRYANYRINLRQLYKANKEKINSRKAEYFLDKLLSYKDTNYAIPDYMVLKLNPIPDTHLFNMRTFQKVIGLDRISRSNLCHKLERNFQEYEKGKPQVYAMAALMATQNEIYTSSRINYSEEFILSCDNLIDECYTFNKRNWLASMVDILNRSDRHYIEIQYRAQKYPTQMEMSAGIKRLNLNDTSVPVYVEFANKAFALSRKDFSKTWNTEYWKKIIEIIVAYEQNPNMSVGYASFGGITDFNVTNEMVDRWWHTTDELLMKELHQISPKPRGKNSMHEEMVNIFIEKKLTDIYEIESYFKNLDPLAFDESTFKEVFYEVSRVYSIPSLTPRSDINVSDLEELPYFNEEITEIENDSADLAQVKWQKEFFPDRNDLYREGKTQVQKEFLTSEPSFRGDEISLRAQISSEVNITDQEAEFAFLSLLQGKRGDTA